MLLAQAFGEYGAMAILAEAIQSGIIHVETFVRGLGVKEYVLIAVAGFVLVKIFGRR